MDNSTETNVVNSGEQEEVVVPESHNSDFDIVDAPASELEYTSEEPKEEAKEEEKADDGQSEVVDTQKQTKEDNHFAKLARLNAQKEARANAERLANARLAQMLRESGVENPYTDKPFETVEEFQEYGKKVREAKLREKAESTGQSYEEVEEEENAKAYLRNKKREEESNRLAAQKRTEAEQASRNFFMDDLQNFMEAYPDVDVAKLDNNQNFRRFCGSRYGHEPLANLYKDYTELVSISEKAGAAKRDTRNDRSTGTGSSGGARLTAEQQRSLQEWNTRHPEMKMTPQEYMSR